jgi:hypothetical protein
MVIYYLQFFQSIIHLSGGLILVLISMCALIYPCFHHIRSEGLDPCCCETGDMHVFLVLVRSI